MTSSKDDMVLQLETYFNKVQAHIQPLIFDIDVNIVAGSTKTYDLKALFIDHALYELRSTTVSAQTLVTDSASPLFNSYQFNDPKIITSVSIDGIVAVRNTGTGTATVNIRIDHPSVRK